MNAVMRDPKTLNPQWLLEYSSYKNQVFEIPAKDDVIADYDIVVSTCSTSGYLYSIGVAVGSFTHIIIDEAGEALEAEALIPLTLAGPSTVIILAGDPKQLGPIIHSPLCKKYNMDKSMLERLTTNRGGIIVKLEETYRSHPDILELYSTLFYEGSLISRASNDAYLFKDCPLRFIHVESVEQRDRDSPSWYNEGELEEVMKQIQMIHNSIPYKTKKITNEDIGIITPYRKQMERIKQRLYALKITGITVGTTELFQGQERKIIILSTVRSTRENLVHDDKFKLGFLNNPKRLNVAISRAISQLIIIGNYKILSLDPCWKQLLDMFFRKEAVLIPKVKFTGTASGAGDAKLEYFEFSGDWKDYN
jgi:helicase MOV-10